MKMRGLFITLFVANLIVILVSLFVLPSQVAIHFAGEGRPDSWASRELNALLFAVLDIVLFFIFFSIPAATLRFPTRWTSLPNREYWLKPENKQLVFGKLSALMDEFGAGLFLFLLLINLLAIDANLSDPVRLNVEVLMLFFVLYMLYVVYWTIKIIRTFRLPKSITR